MENTFLYQAFGLTIESGFPINQLIPSAGKPDIVITLGKTPDTIPNAIIKTDEYQTARGQFLFTIKTLATYYVREGCVIIISPVSGKPFNDIITYLLGTVFGALLFQRGILPLHGSTVNMNGSAVIFVARSGRGKSTLVRSLLKRGHTFLTDDLSAILFEKDGIPKILPGFPQQKLWADSLDEMAVPVDKDSLVKVMGDMDKYCVPSRESFCDHPLKPTHIYELIPYQEKKIRIERIQGADKINTIMKNTYFTFLPSGFDISESHFSQCIKLAKQVMVSRIFRPEKGFMINELTDAVENDYSCHSFLSENGR